MNNETFLVVSFSDNPKVKALGARFDMARRQWYVPKGRDLAPFREWLPYDRNSAGGELIGHSLPAKGVRLSSLLADVSAAVAERIRGPVWVFAEVLRVSDHASGHVFLEICDGDAKARAAIWAQTARAILPRFQKATGMVLGPNLKLLVQAQVSFSAQHGLTLAIHDIDPEYSLGDLEARKREIIRILKEEGVVDNNRRLPAPWDFNAVLVVAPAAAAAEGDFMAEANRLSRAGVCEFKVIHARFQGEGAPEEIASTLATELKRRKGSLPDAVILIRGGGAVIDLACLNDLALTRYLAMLPIPVITAIGHERDRTTLDEVAHQSCDTPSKAIAHVIQVIRSRTDEAKVNFRIVTDLARRSVAVPRESIARHLANLETAARRQVFRARENARTHLHDTHTEARSSLDHARFASGHALEAIRTGSMLYVRELKRQLAEACETLSTQPSRRLSHARARAKSNLDEVHAYAISRTRQVRATIVAAQAAIATAARTDVRQVRREMTDAIKVVESTSQEHLHRTKENARALLNEVIAMGPQKSLRRGFTIVRDAEGRPVTRAQVIKAKDELHIEFQDGIVSAITQSSIPKE